jgi:hypothetical protein
MVRGNHHGRARDDSGRKDYHDPAAGFGGAPPARSVINCGVGAAAFVIIVSEPVIAGCLLSWPRRQSWTSWSWRAASCAASQANAQVSRHG